MDPDRTDSDKLFVQAAHNLRIDIAAAVVNGLFLGLVLPFLAVMALRFGGDAWDTAIIAAAPAAANLLAIVWGRLTQKADRVRLIFLFHGLARFMVLFMAFTVNSSVIVVLTLLFFVLQGVAMPAYVGLMRSIYPDSIRGKYMAYVRVSGGISTLAGIYAAGAWFEGHFRMAAILAFFLGIIGIVMFSRIREPGLHSVRNTVAVSWKDTFAALTNDRRFQLLLAGIFIYEFFFLLPSSAYPLYQVEKMHLTNGQIGLISMATTASALVFNPIWGRIIDRYSTMPVLLVSALTGAAMPFVYWIAPSMGLLVSGAFAAGIASAGMDLAWINYISRSAGKHITSFSGIYLTLVGVRGILAPLCGVITMRILGTSLLFGISFFMMLLSLIPFVLLQLTHSRRQRDITGHYNEMHKS
ncbi:MFS transporter [Cohnella silvisoli]|uniref:MFS transporter n=1 Tax=Cohnella silvisoli TaxID=2873699 RepID=A0ABV1KTK4_9BACL|nr:MFS transporter [Cohnella silvisoli]MCD9022914.1 MFS transporter [Cohnella silvisoli]